MARIAAIVLAAGRSSRMAGGQKLALPWGESTILASTLTAIRRAGLFEVIVVGSAQTAGFLESLGEAAVINNQAEMGLTTSIQAGIRYADAAVEGFMICLGDMPLIRPATYSALAKSFSTGMEQHGRVIVQPEYNSRRGQPVLFSSGFREILLNHRKMHGCRDVIAKNSEYLTALAVNDPGVTQDIDDRETYERLAALSRRS